MPAETSTGVGLELEYALVEIPITIESTDVFKINLRRYDHEHPENEWDKQSLESLPRKLGGSPLAHSHIGTCPGDEQQQRHAPVVQPHHPKPERSIDFGVLDMVTPLIEHHAGVKKQEYNDSDKPEPVEVMSAF
jgi:hypothetical protein